MADTKISALSASTTPLAGTEVLPIVQSGTTVKVAVSNLTAGRDVAVKNLAATGAVAIGTAGTYSVGSIYADANWGMLFTSAQASPGAGEFAWLNSVGTEMGRFTNTAGNDFKVTTGNLVIGTSGKGIDFSATSGAGTSELLNDYEEGTWTPSLGGTATYGGATYGRYTKIGRVVTVQFRIDVTLLGTGSNTILSGLPFTSSGAGIQTVACSYYQNLAVNTIYLAGYVDSNATNMYFLGNAASGATVNNNIALFGNGTVLVGTASYVV
jgi:hypothetical protein